MIEVANLNIFMMCTAINRQAFGVLPEGLQIRTCRRSELEVWKRLQLDDEDSAEQLAYLSKFYDRVYQNYEEEFYAQNMLVCDQHDIPVAACLIWKAYREFTTIHWLKVHRDWEGMGIGRALLSELLTGIAETDLPIYLHTQPTSYRAIKLYSDFGFCLIEDDLVGSRSNDLHQGLPYLEMVMHAKDFKKLRICQAPSDFLTKLQQYKLAEF